MGNILRKESPKVIQEITKWIKDPNSSRTWIPFALSVRGAAYEMEDKDEQAKADYKEGIQLYKKLGNSQSTEKFRNNIQYMRQRYVTLGGVQAGKFL